MKPSLVGYADLLRALNQGGPEAMQTVARLLHLHEQPKPFTPQPNNKAVDSLAHLDLGVDTSTGENKQPLQGIPFWRLVQIETLTDDVNPPPPKKQATAEFQVTRGEQPTAQRLMQKARLARQLRQQATQLRTSRTLDMDCVVERISRAQRLASLPWIRKRVWGSFVQVICDRSDRLIPYWADQVQVLRDLDAWFPTQRVEYGSVIEGFQQPVLEHQGGYRPPPSGSMVLVLGDLGCLDQSSTEDTRQWLSLGRAIREAGCRTVALVPRHAGQYRDKVAQSWELISWGAGAEIPTQAQLEADTKQLLALCAQCTRLEPGLLRAMRYLLGADAAVEALVWQQPLLSSQNICAAPTNRHVRQSLRAQWPRDLGDESSLWHKALQLQSEWRTGYSEELWAAEVLDMPREIQALPEIKAHLPRAFEIIRQMDDLTAQGGNLSGIDQWLQWYMPISSDHAEIQSAVTHLYDRFCDPGTVPAPLGYQPKYSDKAFDQLLGAVAVSKSA